MKSILQMIDLLKDNSRVLGLLEYGSNIGVKENFEAGDYDLLVILDHLDYEVNSLHFYIANTPVDLNLKTIDELQSQKILTGFETAFVKGNIIYDPTNELARHFDRLRLNYEQTLTAPLTENAVASVRHGHKHVLDKVKNRIESAPAFCSFLLNVNLYWLIQSYFYARNLQYPGEKGAFEYLENHEPEIYHQIEQFYLITNIHEKIQIAKKITGDILQPVGGMWHDNEIISFGTDRAVGLQEQGYTLFRELFETKT